MSDSQAVDPNTFVIFGGTGDLSRRKLIPALGRLAKQGLLGERAHLLGVARDATQTDESFRKLAHESMVEAGIDGDHATAFARRCHYQTIAAAGERDYATLATRISALEQAEGLPQNRTFYLSMPTQAFGPTLDGLGGAGLNHGKGWTRLVIDKPFGRDLASARELNQLVHKTFG